MRYATLLSLVWVQILGAAAFEIEPFLVGKSQRVEIVWRPTLPDRGMGFSIFHRGVLSKKATAQRRGGVFFGELPVKSCGFGPHWSYQVEGQPNPYPIQDIPCEGTAKLGFLGDTQQGPDRALTASELLKQRKISALLHGGDIVHHGGREAEWLNYFKAVQELARSTVTFPVIGNHEYREDGALLYFSRFFAPESREGAYSFWIGGAHVVVINSCFEDEPSLIERQKGWLVKELAVPAAWKIVAMHHPPFGRHIMQHPLAPRKEHLHLREHYVPLFEKARVRLVLAAHAHVYEHSRKEGIEYLTTGAAGGTLGIFGAKNPYSVQALRERTVFDIELSKEKLQVTVLNLQGETVDEVSLHP